MLSFKDAKGKRYAPQPFYVAGTFERELELKADIPAGVCDGKLILGLQDVTGKVSFDLSTLQVRENRNARKPLPRALRWQSSVSHRELNLTFAPGTPERAIADTPCKISSGRKTNPPFRRDPAHRCNRSERPMERCQSDALLPNQRQRKLSHALHKSVSELRKRPVADFPRAHQHSGKCNRSSTLSWFTGQ